MLTKPQDTPLDSHYEAAIALMQTYDCSYEEAQRHLQMLGSHLQEERESMQLEGERQGGVEEDHQVLGAGERVVRFTPKQLKALGGFFNGTLIYFKPHRRQSFCQQFTAKLKNFKRKLKCFKYIHPKRIWRALRRRHPTNYKKVSYAELNSSMGENVKEMEKRSSQKWLQVDADWMDEFQEIGEELSNYLTTHRELVKEVKGLSNDGVKVAVPTDMSLPPALQPLLIIRENTAENIAENVKLAAEKVFRVACIDREQYQRLFGISQNDSLCISLAGYNIFFELQVLDQYRVLTMEDLETGQQRFKEFLIKNRLFKSIIDRDLHDVAFAQEDAGSSEDEEESRRRDIQAHQSIIKEQDMLYQSMLSAYTARETERETSSEQVDQSLLQLERQRKKIKQTIRQEPSPSPETLHLTFRTPNGDVLSRHFHRSDTIQYVKNWIFVDDRVEFEDTKGAFDLYHGYPPALLEGTPNDTLSSIFGSEQKVRLIIKEN